MIHLTLSLKRHLCNRYFVLIENVTKNRSRKRVQMNLTDLARLGARVLCRVAPVCVLLQVASMATEQNTLERGRLVFIGTYTSGQSQGIYSARFDEERGTLDSVKLAVRVSNPSFLALHPNGRFLYAVGELDKFQGKPSGAVNAFRLDDGSGTLELINQQPSGGTGPCHVSLSPSGKSLLVANYGSGSVASYAITENGGLTPPVTVIQHHGSSVNHERQSGPHGHFIQTDAAGKLALACDLGLDQVLIYRLEDAQARLTPNEPPFVSVTPGAGPRHLAFHPSGRWVFLVTEMGSTVTPFSYDSASGRLTAGATLSTLPTTFKGHSSGAEVQVHPSGHFVYTSNRGCDSISVFRFHDDTGKLNFITSTPCGGKTPRHFALSPYGRWLLVENQDSNSIVIFKVDPQTGELSRNGESVELGAPVCLLFAPDTRKP